MFDWKMISEEDRMIAANIMIERLRSNLPPLGFYPQTTEEVLKFVRLPQHNLILAPAGIDRPYLYRWHIVRTQQASVYFHIQVDDDPERPLHDHPWDNQSVILAGGYREVLSQQCNDANPTTYLRRPGDVIWRKATWPHRLLMAPGVKYTMSLFSTGPKIREWGFWYPRGWVSYKDVTRVQDGVSIHVKSEGEQ